MSVLWLIAGFWIGWIGVEFLFGIFTLRISYLYNILAGFIGALTTYTYLYGS